MARCKLSLYILVFGLFKLTEAGNNLQCPPPSAAACSGQPFHCLDDHNCFPGGKCCPSGCGKICQKGVCGPVCAIACSKGYELKRDEFGCSLCQCVPLCYNHRCHDGQVCELRPHSDCSTSSCPRYPTCVDCPVVRCAVCPKNWSYKITESGCQTCECQDVCAGINCPVDQICRPKYKEDCHSNRCNPVPFCSPIDPTINLQCPTQEVLSPGDCVEACSADSDCQRGEKCCYNACGHVCRTAVCGPECEIACMNGFELKKDPFGCKLCECVHPCENKVCDPLTYCNLQAVQCVRAPCFAVAVCLPCSQETCSPCGQGQKYKIAPNGCQTCECQSVCLNHICPVGQRCYERDGSNGPFPVCSGTDIVSNYECPPVNPATFGICIDTCTYDFECSFGDLCCDNGCGDTCMRGVCGPQCDLACAPGYEMKKDRYGCSLCQCVKICDVSPCSEGTYCEIEQVPCSTGLCPERFCSPCPDYDCEGCPRGWARLLEANGCYGCDCYDVCEGFFCPSDSSCEAVLPPNSAPGFKYDPVPVCKPDPIKPFICSDAVCPRCPTNWVPRRDAFGCHTCLCYDPCESVWCPAGRHCKVRENSCKNRPCGFSTICQIDAPGSPFSGSEARHNFRFPMAVLGLFFSAVILKEQ